MVTELVEVWSLVIGKGNSIDAKPQITQIISKIKSLTKKFRRNVIIVDIM